MGKGKEGEENKSEVKRGAMFIKGNLSFKILYSG